MKTQFSYEIHTERFYGRENVKREIFISISDHPKMENDTLEYLTVEEVETLRDVCNQILKEVKNEDRRQKAEA
ncbi:MAG: hypothetical protein IJ762_04265 [Bacteroidaceae bacterium]|nr:hypothetical protein [Bacteroidaceae bacterium]MBR1788392.1 hypothetical protein [Bacteroidaceae bacterium]